MVVDASVPNRHQAICNHSAIGIISHNTYCRQNWATIEESQHTFGFFVIDGLVVPMRLGVNTFQITDNSTICSTSRSDWLEKYLSSISMALFEGISMMIGRFPLLRASNVDSVMATCVNIENWWFDREPSLENKPCCWSMICHIYIYIHITYTVLI